MGKVTAMANNNRVVVVIAGENQADKVIKQVEASLGGLNKTATQFGTILQGIHRRHRRGSRGWRARRSRRRPTSSRCRNAPASRSRP
jgi:hypothetical protein